MADLVGDEEKATDAMVVAALVLEDKQSDGPRLEAEQLRVDYKQLSVWHRNAEVGHS
jgi:hypothetical protein